MIFICVGDIHFQDKYSHRLDDVRKTFTSKFEEIYNWAERDAAEAIILTGDIFNNKNPRNISHDFMSFVCKLLSEAPCPIYSIIGNHDVLYNDITRIDKHPLGVLFASGLIKPLCSQSFTREGEPMVSIRGYNYGFDFNTLNLSKDSDSVHIAITHCHASQEGGSLFGNEKIWSFKELEKLKANYILNGHDHTPYSNSKFGITTLLRPGGLFRASRGKEDRERLIKITKIDTKKLKTYTLVLPYKKSDEVFDFTTKELLDDENQQIAEFVGQLSETNFKSAKSVSDELDEMNISKDIRAVVNGYLDEVKRT